MNRPIICHGRVYVKGRRIHHGLTGIVMIVLGALLVWDDWHDRPWRLYDKITP